MLVQNVLMNTRSRPCVSLNAECHPRSCSTPGSSSGPGAGELHLHESAFRWSRQSKRRPRKGPKLSGPSLTSGDKAAAAAARRRSASAAAVRAGATPSPPSGHRIAAHSRLDAPAVFGASRRSTRLKSSIRTSLRS